MPSKKLRRWETLSPRYLTFSCHRRLGLLSHAAWRDELARSLEAARVRCGFALWAWVVMPEHVHVILVPTEALPVGRVLRAIKQPVAQRAINRWRHLRAPILAELKVGRGYRYWQAGGGFDRNVRDMEELEREIDYIHRNPVERGLVAQPTEWEWSSARWYAGRRDVIVRIDRIEGWSSGKFM